MARQLPDRTDPTIERTDDPSVVYLDDSRTEQVVAALSSDSGLSTFRLLNEQPLTASEIAAELGVTVQSVGYHLENLREAGLIEVVDTCYSEKGREMDIFAVTSDPTVLVLTAESDRSHLRNAFMQIAGAVGTVGVLAAVWQRFADTVESVLGV